MLTETLWMVNTRTCNLDCSFCYQGSHKWKWQGEAGLMKMMNSRTAKHALDWASQWAKRGLRVNWYGGEPLLNAKLMAEVMPIWEERFKTLEKELAWSITTNGTMLNQENRDLLDKHKVGILLSLDGPPHIHDKQRTYYQGKPSWQDIPVDDILAWRPDIEIAWVVCPDNMPTPDDFDWMIKRGFQRINFNMNWLSEWDGDSRIKLIEFSRWIARRCIQSMRGELTIDGKQYHVNSNLMAKFNELHLKDQKPIAPCGTGLHMLALTPEGFLYPSQEMAFKAFEPGLAPGTAEHYRVGNIWKDPVIDQARLDDVSSITNEQMEQPPGFDCSNCAANPISFGGCHDAAGDTPVLLANGSWTTINQIQPGDEIVSLTGDPDLNLHLGTVSTSERKFTTTKVLEVLQKPNIATLSIETTEGSIKVTGEHPLLVHATSRCYWVLAENIKPGMELYSPYPVVQMPEDSYLYKLGYLIGAMDGDGGYYWHPRKHYAIARLADVKDLDFAITVLDYGNELTPGEWRLHEYKPGQYTARVCTKEAVAFLEETWTPDPEFYRGYLGGIYDAEGYVRSRDLIISQDQNVNPKVYSRIAEALSELNFEHTITPNGFRLASDKWSKSRFIQTVQPIIERRKQWIGGSLHSSRKAKVIAVTPGPKETVYNMHIDNTEGARSFISVVVSHQCRYIGQDGKDPKHRFTVAPGWCQSTQAWVMGFLAGARIEKYTTLKTGASSRPGAAKPQESGPHSMHVHDQPGYQKPKPVQIQTEPDTIQFNRTPHNQITVADVYHEILRLKKQLKGEELEKLQKQLEALDQVARPIAKRINRDEQGE